MLCSVCRTPDGVLGRMEGTRAGGNGENQVGYVLNRSVCDFELRLAPSLRLNRVRHSSGFGDRLLNLMKPSGNQSQARITIPFGDNNAGRKILSGRCRRTDLSRSIRRDLPGRLLFPRGDYVFSDYLDALIRFGLSKDKRTFTTHFFAIPVHDR